MISKKPVPPCLNCEVRDIIRGKHGDCHNKHCPKGWCEYYKAKKRWQKEKDDDYRLNNDIDAVHHTGRRPKYKHEY